jgi:conjugal transfer pilus assembly protein TraW
MKMNPCQSPLLATLLIVSLLISPAITAKPMGVAGAIFAIGEMDMLKWIEARLTHFEQTGKLKSMKDSMKAAIKKKVERPTPVSGLGTTTSPETFYIDPTLYLGKDVFDSQGKLLFAKDTAVNPFDSQTWPNNSNVSYPLFSFSKTLIFIDGDDERQIAWAKDYQSHLSHPKNNNNNKNKNKAIKWILTNGSPNEAATALHARLYFDQNGHLTQKLKLKNTPSVVNQVKTQWQIQEIDVSHQPL